MKKVNCKPYLYGALSGFVSIGSIYFTGKFLGASTTYVRTAAYAENFISSEKVQSMEYFIKNAPKVDWQMMVLLGIFLGALLAALVFKDFKIQALPTLWKDRFGKSYVKRAILSIVGGFILMFGARLADGCPSGHGLSGGLQLSLSSLIALICFFLGGMISANLLYKKRS